MPGFFSWISGLFSPQQPAQVAAETRLFNPSNNRQAESSELSADTSGQLEEHLFCWLLDSQPAKLREDAPGSEKILTELERRLNTSEMEELPRKPGSLPMLMRALSKIGRASCRERV